MKASGSDTSVQDIDPERLVHKDHRDLYTYWLDRRGNLRVPTRGTVDPIDFPHLLSRLAIIEVVDSPQGRGFRYRLAGTEIARRAGRDPTGKTFDELYSGDYLTSARQTYLDIIETARPAYSRRVFPIGSGSAHLSYDRLILPVSSDGKAVDQFILLIVVIDQNAKTKQIGSFEVYSDE